MFILVCLSIAFIWWFIINVDHCLVNSILYDEKSQEYNHPNTLVRLDNNHLIFINGTKFYLGYSGLCIEEVDVFKKVSLSISYYADLHFAGRRETLRIDLDDEIGKHLFLLKIERLKLMDDISLSFKEDIIEFIDDIDPTTNCPSSYPPKPKTKRGVKFSSKVKKK